MTEAACRGVQTSFKLPKKYSSICHSLCYLFLFSGLLLSCYVRFPENSAVQLEVSSIFLHSYTNSSLGTLNSIKVEVELKTLGILTSDKSHFAKLPYKLMTFIR